MSTKKKNKNTCTKCSVVFRSKSKLESICSSCKKGLNKK